MNAIERARRRQLNALRSGDAVVDTAEGTDNELFDVVSSSASPSAPPTSSFRVGSTDHGNDIEYDDNDEDMPSMFDTIGRRTRHGNNDDGGDDDDDDGIADDEAATASLHQVPATFPPLSAADTISQELLRRARSLLTAGACLYLALVWWDLPGAIQGTIHLTRDSIHRAESHMYSNNGNNRNEDSAYIHRRHPLHVDHSAHLTRDSIHRAESHMYSNNGNNRNEDSAYIHRRHPLHVDHSAHLTRDSIHRAESHMYSNNGNNRNEDSAYIHRRHPLHVDHSAHLTRDSIHRAESHMYSNNGVRRAFGSLWQSRGSIPPEGKDHDEQQPSTPAKTWPSLPRTWSSIALALTGGHGSGSSVIPSAAVSGTSTPAHPTLSPAQFAPFASTGLTALTPATPTKTNHLRRNSSNRVDTDAAAAHDLLSSTATATTAVTSSFSAVDSNRHQELRKRSQSSRGRHRRSQSLFPRSHRSPLTLRNWETEYKTEIRVATVSALVAWITWAYGLSGAYGFTSALGVLMMLAMGCVGLLSALGL
ncbi:hypothetical protein GQ42DRAFT_171643 [Ramicandelaber brevisporus]|nr:hypothetical protein GQ42DRAFT_171643 [Ramicandelaber brevisporus]